MSKPLQNCGKCGLCLNACPVYKILKEEQASPRARLQLIKAYENNTLESSPLLKEIISKCLMCGSCAANCPSGIDHYSKFMEMRKKMAQAHGEAPAIKALIYLLAKEYRLKLGAGAAKTGQKLIPESIAETYKLGNIPLKHFPKLNARPFRNTIKETLMPDGRSIGTVAYFTGCATNFIYDDTGLATIGILNHLGFTVIIPKNQTCCSIPLLFHGAQDLAGQNITKNITALKDLKADTILVDCSTCGEALRNEYPKFLEEQGRKTSDAKRIALKVKDVLTFIYDHFDKLEFDAALTEKLSCTYHAPCHTKNHAQSHLIVENLLNKLPFVDYKRAADADDCCGGGGTFFYEHPDIAKALIQKKVTTANNLNVSHWLTDCPVCRMNLAGNLGDNSSLQVLHPVSLIYSALRQI